MSIQFHETRMGQRFYEGTMPKIANALAEIARKLPEPPSEGNTALRAVCEEVAGLVMERDTNPHAVTKDTDLVLLRAKASKALDTK